MAARPVASFSSWPCKYIIKCVPRAPPFASVAPLRASLRTCLPLAGLLTSAGGSTSPTTISWCHSSGRLVLLRSVKQLKAASIAQRGVANLSHFTCNAFRACTDLCRHGCSKRPRLRNHQAVSLQSAKGKRDRVLWCFRNDCKKQHDDCPRSRRSNRRSTAPPPLRFVAYSWAKGRNPGAWCRAQDMGMRRIKVLYNNVSVSLVSP
jgi:hypothetical protein